ncbi:hypothetical protein MKW92_028956 [Papaver armeniacum]|nr:hypothetical protein MKW92_028956 [Papaver armeniacum]
MVAGHSVYIKSYQKHPGQAASFLSHIKKGLRLRGEMKVHCFCLVVVRLGKTAGPRSEAQSYWAVAESQGWLSWFDRGLSQKSMLGTVFENLLFSVCRFWELTGIYPQIITVVGYDFKEERCAQLHLSVIGFPEERFFYKGYPRRIKSLLILFHRLLTSQQHDLLSKDVTRTLFQDDPYGCLGPLRCKKLGRDPFHRSIPYPNGCPELEGLFRYCGASTYPGTLPWP